jgi:hypothetical protein
MDLLFRKRVRIDPLRVNLFGSAPSVSLVAGPASVNSRTRSKRER